MTRFAFVLFALLLVAPGVPVGRAQDPPPRQDVKPVKPVKFEMPTTEFPLIKVKWPPRRDGEPTPKEQAEFEKQFQQEQAEFEKQFQPPKVPEVKDGDGPAVKAAKRKLAADVTTLERLQGRVNSGINTPHEFVTQAEVVASMTKAVDAAFVRAADRLPWYEYRVLMTKLGEEYYFRRTKANEFGGVDATYLLPLASVARLDAEISLLKLKEKIAKK